MSRFNLRHLFLTAVLIVLFIDSDIAFSANDNLPTYAPAVTHAVILVGGIFETSHYFDNWVPALAAQDTVVLGWDHDHRSMSMKNSARLLAKRIDELSGQGITEVTIIAHSMGGLVAKEAVDELSGKAEARNFSHIEIDAFGTPWGGYALADLASVLPFSETISRAIGYPMGPEIGPNSEYMKSLTNPMPANARLNIYVGTADKIALPDSARTKARYKSIEEQASTVTRIIGFNHITYNTAPEDLLNTPHTPIATRFQELPSTKKPQEQRELNLSIAGK